MVSFVLLLIVTVALLCLTALLWCQSLYRLIAYKAAVGHVTGYRREEDCYLPKFEYMTETGETIACVSDSGRGVKSCDKGSEVRVLYSPRDPSKATIRSFSSMWVIPIGLTAIACVFVFFALSEWAELFAQ